jgi:hypothetical protein
MAIDLIERGTALVRGFPDDNLCALCSTSIEVQGHHLWPRHLGGPLDGPLLSLCSKDHLMIHHLTGKKKEIPPGFNESQIKLIKILVQFINIAKLQYDDLDPTWIDRKIIVTLPDALLKRAHKRKQDSGYSNLQDYVLSLIVKDTLVL